MNDPQHLIECSPPYIAGSGAIPIVVCRNCSASAKPKLTGGATFCAQPRLLQTLSYDAFILSTRLTNSVTAFCSVIGQQNFCKSPRPVPVPGSTVTGLRQVATVSMIYRLTVNRTEICWLSFIYRRRLLPAASPFIAM